MHNKALQPTPKSGAAEYKRKPQRMKTQDTYKVHHSFTFSKGGAHEEQIVKYFVHLERLEGIEVTRFHFVPMTDELSVYFSYRGYEFNVWMDWGGDLVLQTTQEAPIAIFEVLKQQLSNLVPVSSEELEEADKRYIKIAKTANTYMTALVNSANASVIRNP